MCAGLPFAVVVMIMEKWGVKFIVLSRAEYCKDFIFHRRNDVLDLWSYFMW